MRLLNVKTLELESFVGADIPRYAILSHTWRDEEILYNDVRHGKAALLKTAKKGLQKLLDSSKLAEKDGYGYIWIDTCCIDKSSSAELSEAINSMFEWYERAKVCYAYLDDYDTDTAPVVSNKSLNSINELSAGPTYHWFTRGWTLQELLAPDNVLFFNARWTPIGSRLSLSGWLSEQTGISRGILRRHDWDDCIAAIVRNPGCCSASTMYIRNVLKTLSISTRMKWAAKRETTRPEDLAYCLMGIFDVNMPLLYGEGDLKAFQRLLEAIMKGPCDQTILAWEVTASFQASRQGNAYCASCNSRLNTHPSTPSRNIPPSSQLAAVAAPCHHDVSETRLYNMAVFANHPSQFDHGLQLQQDCGLHSRVYLRGGDVELQAEIAPCRVEGNIAMLVKSKSSMYNIKYCYVAVLRAHVTGDPLAKIAILLSKVHGTKRSFVRQILVFRPDVAAGPTVFALPAYCTDGVVWSHPDDSSTRIACKVKTLEKRWITLVKERSIVEEGVAPPLRVRYGRGGTGYNLGHPLPTLFQNGWSMHSRSNRFDYQWGLLCFAMDTYAKFFVCWVTAGYDNRVVCSIHSPEELLGQEGFVRDVEVLSSSRQLYEKAQSLAESLATATWYVAETEPDTIVARSIQVQVSDEMTQEITVREEYVIISLDTSCWEIIIEEKSETSETTEIEAWEEYGTSDSSGSSSPSSSNNPYGERKPEESYHPF